MADRPYLSIGEVLGLLRPEFPDLTISKIRFLESQGLLDPERTPSGYRKFYEQDIERLRWILRQQREQYLPLRVIKGKLEVSPEPDGGENGLAGEQVTNEVGESAERAVEPAWEVGHPAGDEHVAPLASLVREATNPLEVVRAGVSLTIEELAATSGLRVDDLRDLERYGLIGGRAVAGTVYFDDEALIVANLAAGFMRYGVEARHLRMYKTAAEREAGFFEQLVMPLLKQRNPHSRRQAVETLGELGRLGQGLRAAMLRMALRDHTAP